MCVCVLCASVLCVLCVFSDNTPRKAKRHVCLVGVSETACVSAPAVWTEGGRQADRLNLRANQDVKVLSLSDRDELVCLDG